MQRDMRTGHYFIRTKKDQVVTDLAGNKQVVHRSWIQINSMETWRGKERRLFKKCPLPKKKQVVIFPLIYLSALRRPEANFRDTQNFRQMMVSPDCK